jgi:hypothetical protein
MVELTLCYGGRIYGTLCPLFLEDAKAPSGYLKPQIALNPI